MPWVPNRRAANFPRFRSHEHHHDRHDPSPLILNAIFPVYNREEHVRARRHHHRHQVLRHLPHGRPLRHGRHADARAVPSGAGTRDRRSGDASENHAGSRNLVIFSRMHLLCIYLRSGKMSRTSRSATTRASAPSSTPASIASKIEDVKSNLGHCLLDAFTD